MKEMKKKIKHLFLLFMFVFMLFPGRVMASEQTNTGTLDIRPGAADEDAYGLLEDYKAGLLDKTLIENILNSGGFSPSVADHVRTEMAAIDAANNQPATSAEQSTVAPTEQPAAAPTIEPTAAPDSEAAPASSPTAEKDAQAKNGNAVALIGIFVLFILFHVVVGVFTSFTGT